MPPPNLAGPNVARLRQHFQAVDGLSVPDINQIVADAAWVFGRCQPGGRRGTTKGLIYGNIQSGKTAVILALLAIGADNSYTRFVVLTSDLNDLYEQTLDRTKNALHGLTVLGKAEIRPRRRAGAAPLQNVAAAQTPNPCVLVLSKNVRVLKGAQAILTSAAWTGKSVLMVDDEADQASLDTKVNKPQTGPSGVNREITALRRAPTSLAFVQTTATPQALLLQDANAPYRPDFVRVTTPGTGYCGGDTFFSDQELQNQRYLRFVPLFDVATLRTHVLPPTLEAAVFGFLVGAAFLRVRGSVKNYQALIHTALKKDEHKFVQELVDELTRRISVTAALAAASAPVPPADQPIVQNLQNAYADITGGIATPPSFQAILSDLAATMPSTAVIEINSRTGQGVLANPNRRHIIYVGGAKLGRGVTLKNLLVTYYARDAQSPQVDTVLQHARMYGYRQNELPCTRIYLPAHLATRFREIHRSDNAMRDLAATTGTSIPVIPIPIRSLRATRRNVLSELTVEMTTYIGGRQYYPLVPESSGPSVVAQTALLDAELARRCPNDQQPYNTTIADIASLLARTFSTVGAPGAWNDDLIRKAVELLQRDRDFRNQAQILVGNRNSDVGKLSSRGVIPQIQALLPAGAGNPPYGARPDRPVLLFMKLKGNRSKGWDGVPFWVPNIRFPDGNYAFSLNRT